MREANATATVNRFIGERNFIGAQLYIKRAEIDSAEREEFTGQLAAAVVEDLSRTRREDRERLAYLRGILAWVLRDVPGLATLYREQLRLSLGRSDVLSDLTRGLRNVGDVAGGRKSFQEGVQDATEDVRRNFEEAGERFRATEGGANVSDFFRVAERGIRDGLDQLGTLFRTMNEGVSDDPVQTDEEAAARAQADEDVEDAEFQVDDEPNEDINVERE